MKSKHKHMLLWALVYRYTPGVHRRCANPSDLPKAQQLKFRGLASYATAGGRCLSLFLCKNQNNRLHDAHQF
jgi:hypothetical protein